MKYRGDQTNTATKM